MATTKATPKRKKARRSPRLPGSRRPPQFPAPARSTLGLRPTDVGDTVLFRIDRDGRDAPLLVLYAVGTVVSGILFVDPGDAGAEWIRRYFFSRPTPEQPFKYVDSIRHGSEVGQWRPRP